MGRAIKNKRRLSGTIGALIVFALLVAACSSSAGSSSSGGGGAAASDSVLRVGVLQQFVNPNPFNLANIIDYHIAQLDYPALVQYSHSQPAPDLAKSWTSSAGGK